MRNLLKHAALFALLAASPALAAPVTIALPEPDLALKQGPGSQTAQNACQGCHSLDYIQTQPPHLGAAFWTGEVTKMIKTYGAPVSDADAKVIADYLAGAY
jgi:mono/diheme cytochrome c family protein